MLQRTADTALNQLVFFVTVLWRIRPGSLENRRFRPEVPQGTADIGLKFSGEPPHSARQPDRPAVSATRPSPPKQSGMPSRADLHRAVAAPLPRRPLSQSTSNRMLRRRASPDTPGRFAIPRAPISFPPTPQRPCEVFLYRPSMLHDGALPGPDTIPCNAGRSSDRPGQARNRAANDDNPEFPKPIRLTNSKSVAVFEAPATASVTPGLPPRGEVALDKSTVRDSVRAVLLPGLLAIAGVHRPGIDDPCAGLAGSWRMGTHDRVLRCGPGRCGPAAHTQW